MAKTPTFSNILDRPVGLTERPKPMPVGQYLWVLQGQPREDVSTTRQTPFVEFTAKCLGPVDDDTVDEDALKEYLTNPDGTKKKIGDITQKMPFYLTDNALWRLQRFLQHLGFDPNSDASFSQMLAETAGKQFLGTIKHTQSQDGEMTFARIDTTAPAE